MRTVNLTGNLKRRWQFAKHFFNEAQKPDFWLDVNKFAKSMTKEFFEISLEEEMIQYQQRKPYQRNPDRIDYRNGYYTRNMDTAFGPIERIKVPRSRSGLFEPSMFNRYQRRQESVNQSIINCFLLGVSTRNVKDVLKPLIGIDVSASTVSNATKAVDKLVKEFHQRPLIDEYQFLFLDGINISVRYGAKSIKKTVLAAYGITLFGQRELIDFRIVKSESKDAWESFLNDLYRRGLKGDHLKLIITDGGKGLIAALAIVYPLVKHQRCWFHKLQMEGQTLIPIYTIYLTLPFKKYNPHYPLLFLASIIAILSIFSLSIKLNLVCIVSRLFLIYSDVFSTTVYFLYVYSDPNG